MYCIHSSSGDSTIRLWEDSKEENGVNGIKAGSILSHSILPTEQNDITCIDWSVRFLHLIHSSRMVNNLSQLRIMVKLNCGQNRALNLPLLQHMIDLSSMYPFHQMRSMCWLPELFLRFTFLTFHSQPIVRKFWILCL